MPNKHTYTDRPAPLTPKQRQLLDAAMRDGNRLTYQRTEQPSERIRASGHVFSDRTYRVLREKKLVMPVRENRQWVVARQGRDGEPLAFVCRVTQRGRKALKG